jgi:hypothetical protein
MNDGVQLTVGQLSFNWEFLQENCLCLAVRSDEGSGYKIDVVRRCRAVWCLIVVVGFCVQRKLSCQLSGGEPISPPLERASVAPR